MKMQFAICYAYIYSTSKAAECGGGSDLKLISDKVKG
jgi:hypothetical protein